MTPDLLERIGLLLYGAGWTHELAARLGVDERRLRRMRKGEAAIPPGFSAEIRKMITVRRAALASLREQLPGGGEHNENKT